MFNASKTNKYERTKKSQNVCFQDKVTKYFYTPPGNQIPKFNGCRYMWILWFRFVVKYHPWDTYKLICDYDKMHFKMHKMPFWH